MSEVIYAVVMMVTLGIYWAFVAPRIERAPKWFKVPFVVIGGTLILGFTVLVLAAAWAKFA